MVDMGDLVSKRLFLKNGQMVLPTTNSSAIRKVPLTKTHFLDAYSQGRWNLSKVPRPSFFDDCDIMAPPDHYSEVTRLNSVKQYMNNEQWKNREPFMNIIAKASKFFSCKGASISLVDDKKQINKFQSNLNITECPRKISIDAHAILSSGNFVLLDASKDWRTSRNPFVKNVPYIKFYAGIPLVTKLGTVIGVFAVFDSFPRTEFTMKQSEFLQELSDEIMRILSNPVNETTLSSRTIIPFLQVIGRPTSQGKHSVYEKDGSGSQYSQNYNFRYSKDSATKVQDYLFEDDVVRELSRSKDIKLASEELSKIILKETHYDFCAIIEIRVTQTYQIQPEYFPNENAVDAETFTFVENLVKLDKERIISRILGSYGYTNTGAFLSDSRLYYSALSAEFGIYFENLTNPAIKHKSGIVMPFYRTNPKLVRRKKIIKTDQAPHSNRPIEVYSRSGGFLVAVFKEKEDQIKVGQIDFIYGSACALRRRFISN